MVIQCKKLISLYILPDQRRVNLSAFFDYIRGQKAPLKIQIPIERKVKEASKNKQKCIVMLNFPRNTVEVVSNL